MLCAKSFVVALCVLTISSKSQSCAKSMGNFRESVKCATTKSVRFDSNAIFNKLKKIAKNEETTKPKCDAMNLTKVNATEATVWPNRWSQCYNISIFNVKVINSLQ